MSFRWNRSAQVIRAFTLLELLVVVAIVALLIRILLPALHNAREHSKQMLCLTNLRSQWQAAYFYAEQNRDTIVRGETDLLHFASCLLNGLGYEGSVSDLWSHRRQWNEACRQIELLQCPNHPRERQPLDYVVNAFAYPYTARNVQRDGDGGNRGEEPQAAGSYDNIDFFRLDELAAMRPAELIYITEGHRGLKNRDHSLHDTFFTSHLPFGAFPRIANDQRHPGGINALFFDGHARTMPLHAVDRGWPYSLGERLRWFTVVPDDLVSF